LAVDGVSVTIQVLLFVGIGYYAGARTKWAQTTGERRNKAIGAILTLLNLTSGEGGDIEFKINSGDTVE